MLVLVPVRLLDKELYLNLYPVTTWDKSISEYLSVAVYVPNCPSPLSSFILTIFVFKRL